MFYTDVCEQVIAKGMVFSDHAYLRSGWNIIDGTLVVISLVDLIISLTASTSPRIFGILRVFRLLRALKPLRYVHQHYNGVLPFPLIVLRPI